MLECKTALNFDTYLHKQININLLFVVLIFELVTIGHESRHADTPELHVLRFNCSCSYFGTVSSAQAEN